uniref:Uncharacterized protein n=1 Tax=Sinocyclocheilus rhinocerous TaxID=307959 RepID=A0A673FSU3_9TELE
MCSKNVSNKCLCYLSLFQCLWCISSQKCIDYPVKSILPSHSVCPLSEARWGVCWSKTVTFIVHSLW